MASTVEPNAIVHELRNKFGTRINIADDCDLAPDVLIEMSGPGWLRIGHHVSIRRGTTIQVNPGARVVIDDNTEIGENVFIAAMVGIRIGKGCGISNMVDIHDANHCERSVAYLSGGDLTPYGSGFEGAPVIIESGVIISNKVSITAGVRIGQNSIIGANSVVSRSIPHSVVAVGSPARPIRTFAGHLHPNDHRAILRIGFFGASIMEHYEAYAPSLYVQSDLPQVGSQVTIERWVHRGFAHRIYQSLQAAWPNIELRAERWTEIRQLAREYSLEEQRAPGILTV